MKTELMKKIENSRTIEKEKYIKNISSFVNFFSLLFLFTFTFFKITSYNSKNQENKK